MYEMKPLSKKNNETGVWKGIIFEALSRCLVPESPVAGPIFREAAALYFSRLQNVFLQNTKCICSNSKMYLSNRIIFVSGARSPVSGPIFREAAAARWGKSIAQQIVGVLSQPRTEGELLRDYWVTQETS